MLKPPCLMALDWFHHHSRSQDHLFSPFWALWARHLSVLRTNHRRGRSVRPAVGSASRNKSSSGFWFQIHLPLAPGRVRAEVSERVGHQRPTGRSLDWMQEWMSWWIEIQERHGWLNEGVGDWLAVWIYERTNPKSNESIRMKMCTNECEKMRTSKKNEIKPNGMK